MKNTLNFKLLLLTALIFALSFSACKKNDQPFTTATVINGGVVAADGCGWLIRIGDTNYSPTNLADQFKETELKVSIRYDTLTTKFVCGLGATKMSQIKLLEIKKR